MACFNVRFRYGLAMLTLKVMFHVGMLTEAQFENAKLALGLQQTVEMEYR